MMRLTAFTVYFVAVGLTTGLAGEAPGTKPVGPLSPREELATFRVLPGFRVQLVAAEPEVIDPICLTFDENGRLFVIEMRGYPNGGVGTGTPVLPGRIKLLEDKDNDGYFEKSSVFADELRFPTGMTPWRGGLLVANAPDLIYLKDTNGDGQADEKKILYTGFGTRNIQQLLNGLQFHFDNWIHGCNGLNESVIQSAEKPDLPGLELRSRHVRFQPDVPGSLEPTSGGGQYGLAADDQGNWLTCTNAQHIRHIVIPDHYLGRNPNLAVSEVVRDIPDGIDEHHAAAKVFRISAFEPWREERTRRRRADPMGRRFASTELVPGGYITSATGLIVNRAKLFPDAFQGNVFLGDPANNLIHRDVLEPDGPTFKAKRGDADCEFLASTDNWFRPVFLHQGPDGAIYVCDFYREVIETPLSLPEDIQQQYNLQSRERGRIWRIVPENFSRTKLPALGELSDTELVHELSNSNAWWRLTAQRLLMERRPSHPKVLEALEKMASAENATARLHALWTMQGLGALTPIHVRTAVNDPSANVRRQALVWAEAFMGKDMPLRHAVFDRIAMEEDDAVLFQLAFSIGAMKATPTFPAAILEMAKRVEGSSLLETAYLTSVDEYGDYVLLDMVVREKATATTLGRLAEMAAATASGERADYLLKLTLAIFSARKAASPSAHQLSVLSGFARGLARTSQPLSKRLTEANELAKPLADVWKRIEEFIHDEKSSLNDRIAGIRLLGYGSSAVAKSGLEKLLNPQHPQEVQLAAVQALSQINDQSIAETLIADWPAYSPSVRREVQEALFARADRLPILLRAIGKGQIPPAELELVRRDQLLKHPNKEIRSRAEKLLASQVPPERRKVVDAHLSVLNLTGNAERGKIVFKKNCATCHRLDNTGVEVGADLLAALTNKTRETLLIDILDPSREVDPRYVNYVAESKNGRIFSGIIASETSSNIVLRRAEKAEDTLLRSEIESLQSTAKSLMPEGLEKQMNAQELADVMSYLLKIVGAKNE